VATEINYRKGTAQYNAVHALGKQLVFSYNPKQDRASYEYSDEKQAKAECELADAMANVAELNGLSANDLQHLFPAVLRMLKSNSPWAK
jgi:hypothetical protein